MRVLALNSRHKADSLLRSLISISLVVIAIKALALVLDPSPGFHFGDSGAYLATALAKWIPPDRSFTYGFLIRPLVFGSHSLVPLLVFQTMMSAGASIVLALLLLRYFHASYTVALVFAALCAVEPLQLMSERFVMAETAATFGFSLFVWAYLEFFFTRRIIPLIVAQLLGAAIVSLRYSFLPLVLLMSVVGPLLTFRSEGRSTWRPVLVKLSIAVLASQCLLAGYRHLYGDLAHCRPAYLSRDGDFLVSDVAPIVRAEDFPIAEERESLFHRISIPRSGIDTRRLHRWLPGGICDAILQIAKGDEDRANQLARRTALHAIRRDPQGLIRLAWGTLAEFFTFDKVEWALRLDQGQFVSPTTNDIAMIRRWFGIDVSHRQFGSLTKRWEALAVPWCWLVVALPFVYAMYLVLHWRDVTAADVFLLLAEWSLLLAAIVPVEIANPRYLTPLPWLSLLVLPLLRRRVRLGNPGQRPEAGSRDRGLTATTLI